jgi:hypothetical protein
MLVGLDNVVFVVEDRPEDGSLDLLGLYDGLALTERDRYGTGSCPTGSSSTVSRICTRARRSRSCATRCTPRSSTRSRTSTGSTTSACTSWAGHDDSPRGCPP